MKDLDKTSKATIALFLIYLIALFWIIVFKFNVPFSYLGDIRRINLIPFNQLLILNGKVSYGEIMMNILIFIPLGIYTGTLFKSWVIGKKLIVFLTISLVCEVSQYILAVGVFDITDIINNSFGGLIGLMAYIGLEKAINNRLRVQRFINIIATIATILMILGLSLIKISKIWIFRM